MRAFGVEAVVSFWWVALPVAAEALWAWAFLPRAWRFYHAPGGWWSDGESRPDDPSTWPPRLAADMAWREFFVLYHLPGVAAIYGIGLLNSLGRSFWSVPVIITLTGAIHSAILWWVSTRV